MQTTKQININTVRDNQAFLTVTQARKALGVAPITLYREFKKGNIPGARKVASRILIPRSFVFPTTSEKSS